MAITGPCPMPTPHLGRGGRPFDEKFRRTQQVSASSAGAAIPAELAHLALKGRRGPQKAIKAVHDPCSILAASLQRRRPAIAPTCMIANVCVAQH